MSPVAITFDAVNDPCINRFPAVLASKIPKWLTVPQSPVAAENSMAASLLAVPDAAAPKLAATLA
jgi:hypothetical protein